jgi:gamma-glutamylcyclotransferase (GGCT)/AIG2-like uncharacterized protein YtfP
LKVEWFPDWLKYTRLAIIGEKSKNQLKENNLLLLKNPNKNKSVVVRAVSINEAIFSEIKQLADLVKFFESNEHILLSRMLENVLNVAKDDWVTLESPQTNLFTYGTFLSAFWDFTNSEYPFLVLPGSRHYVLEEFHFLRAKLDDFIRIWPHGLSFPFIIPQEGFVLGEIYFDVAPNKFVELDRIEGEGYLYNRENISVELLDAPFKGLKVDAVTYVGADNLISEYPKQPIFDRLTFGDVYYIEREETWQKHIVKEELFIKHVKGTIPILITTYSQALEAQYRENAGKIFEISVDELYKVADEIMKEIFLQSDEKQLPYALIETLQNIWSPKILDNYYKKQDLKDYFEATCNSFVLKMQEFTKECIERFEKCIFLILKSHPHKDTDLIIDSDLIEITNHLKSTYQLIYSTDKDKIIEDSLIKSNIEKTPAIKIKIQEEILLNPVKRKNFAAEIAEILLRV